MLVLSRRIDAGDRSTICIGNDMEITLIEVQGDEVRIGVTGPREAVVDGCALWKQMPQEPDSDKNQPEGAASSGEE